MASGSVTLSVPPRERTLTVEAVPAEPEIAPGGETSIEVVVKDAAGAPVAGAEVAVVAVDESVLALTGYRIGDPIPMFYGGRGYMGQTAKLRPCLVLGQRPSDRGVSAPLGRQWKPHREARALPGL